MVPSPEYSVGATKHTPTASSPRQTENNFSDIIIRSRIYTERRIQIFHLMYNPGLIYCS